MHDSIIKHSTVFSTYLTISMKKVVKHCSELFISLKNHHLPHGYACHNYVLDILSSFENSYSSLPSINS